MRRMFLAGLSFVITLTPALPRAQLAAPNDATELRNAEVQAQLKTLENVTTDQLLRLIDTGKGNVGVAILKRPPTKTGATVLSHDKITEIYYVLRGSGTQVTGGKIVSSIPFASPLIGPSTRGTSIENGRSSKLGPGDVQVIPPGVAHFWSAIDEGGIEYLVFRVDPERALSLKR